MTPFKIKGRRPSKKRLLAFQTEFGTLVRDFCLSVGGVPHDVGLGGVLIPTRHGPLWVHAIRTEEHLLSDFVTVFARFDDVTRATKAYLFGSNRFSGKWNHHIGMVRDGQTPAECFEYWKRQVLPVLAVTTDEKAQAASEVRKAIENDQRTQRDFSTSLLAQLASRKENSSES